MAAAIQEEPRVADLRQRLLALGGEAIAWRGDPFLAQILERGQVFAGESRLRRRASGACHENSAHLWDDNPDQLQIATGYALSEDGCWRQHTWVVDQRPGRKPPVIETTMKRLLYFGFLLTPAEAAKFVAPYKRGWPPRQPK